MKISITADVLEAGELVILGRVVRSCATATGSIPRSHRSSSSGPRAWKPDGSQPRNPPSPGPRTEELSRMFAQQFDTPCEIIDELTRAA